VLERSEGDGDDDEDDGDDSLESMVARTNNAAEDGGTADRDGADGSEVVAVA